jgi:hypothetical protein
MYMKDGIAANFKYKRKNFIMTVIPYIEEEMC